MYTVRGEEGYPGLHRLTNDHKLIVCKVLQMKEPMYYYDLVVMIIDNYWLLNPNTLINILKSYFLSCAHFVTTKHLHLFLFHLLLRNFFNVMGSSDSPTSIPDTQKDETQPPNTPDPQMPRNIVSPDTTDSLPRTPDSGLKGQTIIDTVHGLENHDSNSATPDSIISSEPVMPNCEHATDHENSESPTTFNIFINADQDENESVGQPSNEISNDAEQDSTKQTSISNSNLTDKPRGFSSLSTATLGSVNANLVSVVFVKKALENINKSKEAKKNIPLQTSSKKALGK